MPGPMGGRPPRGAKPTVANPGKVFKRIIGFVAKNYLLQCIVVLVCIVLTVFSTIQGTMFTKTLIDQYIMPLMQQTVPDYTQLLHASGMLLCGGCYSSLCKYKDDGLCYTGNHEKLKG